MTMSLSKIEQQIEKLKRQAEQIKSQEKEGVVSRIREAIAHYGITRQELFGASAARPGRKPGRKNAASAAKKKSVKRTPAPAKYADGQGNTWAGRGRKPGWILKAIADGKDIEEYAVKS